MRVEVGCRSCGTVAVDAVDLHVRLQPAGFGPCADFLCPVCGRRRSYGIAGEEALRLVPHGALVVDCSSVDCSSVDCPADDCPAEDCSADDCPSAGPAADWSASWGPGVERPGARRRVELQPLGPQHAAELRDLLATDGWFDEV